MIFLIRYDRRAGEMLSIAAFDDAARATAESVRLELDLSNIGSNTNEEIVLLEAETEADLRKTHRRYFESAQDLLKAAVKELLASSRSHKLS